MAWPNAFRGIGLVVCWFAVPTSTVKVTVVPDGGRMPPGSGVTKAVKVTSWPYTLFGGRIDGAMVTVELTRARVRTTVVVV